MKETPDNQIRSGRNALDEYIESVHRQLECRGDIDRTIRLRRARRSLIRANAPAELIEKLGLEAAILALADALETSGLAVAAQRCRETAANFIPVSATTPADPVTLNAWVYPRSLRRYQQLILHGHPPDVVLHGEQYGIRSCYADEDRNHLLLQRRTDETLWWWSSNECADGYLLPDEPLNPAKGLGGINSFDHGTVIRAGNSNFAHFLWNELDPLLRLLESHRKVELLQDTNTVLDLYTLSGITRVSPELLLTRPSLRVGATLVTTRARCAVLQALADKPLPPLPPERPRPLILLGIRGPGRRELRNEVELMTRLIQALSQQFNGPLILLDGFTYQTNNRNQPQAQQRERACTERVDEIIRRCPQAQLENLSGLDFSTWFQRSEGVRFYVTHEGTMQHKIGWLRPELPGLCLVGSPHANAIARWHRRQCEGSGRIATLPVELFRQQSLPSGQSEAEERNQAFEVLDITTAVAQTLREIRSELELVESDS